MNRAEDSTLMRDYVESGSDRAFTALVDRHFNLVYATALRIANGDTHLAQDVAQNVFTDFARKARTLPRSLLLGGWLYKHTCFTAANAIRKERRRQSREQQALEMNPPNESDPVWTRIGPVLDEAMGRLGASDRDALVLRFFEQKSFKTVGGALGISEEAARKRVDRALEKLRGFFAQRGLGYSAAVLSSALESYAAAAAPPGLASVVAGAALVETAKGGTAIFTMMKLMTITKAHIAMATVLAGLTAAVVYQSRETSRLQRENHTLSQEAAQLDSLRSENERLSKLSAVPTPDLNQNQVRELMRLRGEVGVLKQQLARAKASIAATPKVGVREKSTQDDLIVQQKQIAEAKMNFTRQWMLAFIMYAQDHQQACPSNFDAAIEYFPKGAADENVSTNQFQVFYQGSFNQITNPGQTIVVGEVEPVPGVDNGWLKTYGFADGHVEIHKAQDGNFAPWEAQHTQPPPGP